MAKKHYLSRSFVEFGPFTTEEILDFNSRGILQETDYVRAESGEDWVHVNDWVTDSAPAKTKTAPAPAAEAAPAEEAPAEEAPKAKEKAAPAKKAPVAAKKAPAKKAAKKSA